VRFDSRSSVEPISSIPTVSRPLKRTTLGREADMGHHSKSACCAVLLSYTLAG
jgi:hypothetical protein